MLLLYIYIRIDKTFVYQYGKIVTAANIRMTCNFNREEERLKTFDSWYLNWIDKVQLAQTGMYYSGESDKVKCHFCKVIIGQWEPNDIPVSEHLRFSPNCPLLRHQTTENIPINMETLLDVLPAVSYDVCGTGDMPSQDYIQDTVNTSMPKIEDNKDSTFNYIPKSENNLCKICYLTEYTTVFLPCGHVIACTKCAARVTKCPLCRQLYSTVQQIYLS